MQRARERAAGAAGASAQDSPLSQPLTRADTRRIIYIAGYQNYLSACSSHNFNPPRGFKDKSNRAYFHHK